MIRLWGRATSSNVMKVMWLLAELELPYERRDVGGAFGGTAAPEYRAMQPLGLVPALEEEGGFSLFESNVILRYLCNRHAPASSLYPAPPRARAEVEAWMELQQTGIGRPSSKLFVGLVRTPPEERDTTAIGAAAAACAAQWALLEARLQRHPYICGDTLTLADIAWGPLVHRWFNMALPERPAMPALHAWYQRLLARDAYRATCGGPLV